jgi:Rod binding domain-containing protein
MTAIPLLPAQATPQNPVQHKKLVDAAQQFEAMFLNEMLRNSMSSGGEDGDSADSAGQNGTIQGMGSEAVAKAIASCGGLGIARHIVAEVEQEHAAQQPQQKSETALKSFSGTPMKFL